jgi:tripartite-type tricarboxylate transporter receptor subunit TctC
MVLESFLPLLRAAGSEMDLPFLKAESPFKNFKDLITYARQNPKKLTYGTNAPNSIANLIMEQIAKTEGVQITYIPFKGSAEYQTALLGGHVF